MGMLRWNLKEKTERKTRIITLLCVGLILLSELFFGDNSTLYAAMYLSLFAVFAMTITDNIQRRYFTSVMEYAQAFRLVSLLLSLAFLVIWILTSLQRYHLYD
ncbi:hypothetical protein ACFOD0_06095 [Shewanella intestini]|uniref:DUF202 domain-containing protein n=1 Tax=Shewanella intestini TaxID=2017544 RepID=A0ABS5HXN9_9GAMM|nr:MULTISPECIES: hypothetical protein [Shewanella]MBR9726451.1 hypothetical protein [Shewanella intestini]MRG34983.1 hypothetical protein [Shewanella sp. XMDDZSB0408]